MRVMTTQIPAPAVAARESARRRDGKFGAQARCEAQLELFPAPVDQLSPSLAKASSAFGEQLSENTWEFLPRGADHRRPHRRPERDRHLDPASGHRQWPPGPVLVLR